MTYLSVPFRAFCNQHRQRSRGHAPFAHFCYALLLCSLLLVSFFALCFMPLNARAETAQDQEIEVIHTVGTEEGFCATTETIAVPAGTAVHYCFTIVNSNPVTLTNFQFSMPLLGISNTFQSVIPPGEKLAVTTGYLASVGLFLNPGLTSQINAPVTNTVTVYGKTQDEDEYKYMGQGIARVLVGEAQTTV
ncbi:MAG: hypothetical protein KDE53_35360, partial [Caldilineaceae bacterium]|nr:hypothetical protein [Caldilineaceae bacterium]